jgi:hypothetical protein
MYNTLLLVHVQYITYITCAMPRNAQTLHILYVVPHTGTALASEKMANTATGSTAEMRLANRNTYTENNKSVNI